MRRAANTFIHRDSIMSPAALHLHSKPHPPQPLTPIRRSTCYFALRLHLSRVHAISTLSLKRPDIYSCPPCMRESRPFTLHALTSLSPSPLYPSPLPLQLPFLSTNRCAVLILIEPRPPSRLCSSLVETLLRLMQADVLLSPSLHAHGASAHTVTVPSPPSASSASASVEDPASATSTSSCPPSMSTDNDVLRNSQLEHACHAVCSALVVLQHPPPMGLFSVLPMGLLPISTPTLALAPHPRPSSATPSLAPPPTLISTLILTLPPPSPSQVLAALLPLALSSFVTLRYRSLDAASHVLQRIVLQLRHGHPLPYTVLDDRCSTSVPQTHPSPPTPSPPRIQPLPQPRHRVVP